MTKQTAVEFLEQQFKIYLPSIHQKGLQDAIEQAKEMEKQQIIDAANLSIKDRWYVATKYSNCGEQYYSKTYVKSKI